MAGRDKVSRQRFFFFLNPFSCALGYRTLCSTSREYTCVSPFAPCPFFFLCPFNYNLPAARWQQLRVASSVGIAEAPLRAIVCQSGWVCFVGLAGCCSVSALLRVLCCSAPRSAPSCCSVIPSYLDGLAVLPLRRGVCIRWSPLPLTCLDFLSSAPSASPLLPCTLFESSCGLYEVCHRDHHLFFVQQVAHLWLLRFAASE